MQVKNYNTPADLFYHDDGNGSLTLSSSVHNSYFVLMQYADTQVDTEEDNATKIRIELMASTGLDLSQNRYYSVGRESGIPGLYGNNTYQHEDQQLRILLNVAPIDVTYHVVDKQNKIVISEKVKSSDYNGELTLPTDVVSPLVKTYHYWSVNKFSVSDDTYELGSVTVRSGDTYNDELESIYDSDGHVYVTYHLPTDLYGSSEEGFVDLNPSVYSDHTGGTDGNGETGYKYRQSRSATDNNSVRDANSWGIQYRIEFSLSETCNLENGSDGIDTNTLPVGTHVYPYTNGDGNMYVYDEARWNAQKDGGASTRTRWPWFLLSQYNDPYHVIVTSWQNTHAAKVDMGGTEQSYATCASCPASTTAAWWRASARSTRKPAPSPPTTRATRKPPSSTWPPPTT